MKESKSFHRKPTQRPIKIEIPATFHLAFNTNKSCDHPNKICIFRVGINTPSAIFSFLFKIASWSVKWILWKKCFLWNVRERGIFCRNFARFFGKYDLGIIILNNFESSWNTRWEKSTFFVQKSVTFEPVVWYGWALLLKRLLLNRLSSWLRLDFGRWQLCSWGCLEVTCTWKSRYLSPMIQNYHFLMSLSLWRLHLTILVELRDWEFVGGSIDSLMYSCIFQ